MTNLAIFADWHYLGRELSRVLGHSDFRVWRKSFANEKAAAASHPACLRASEGPVRQFDGCCLGIARPDLYEIGKAGGRAYARSDSGSDRARPQTSKKRACQWGRRRWRDRPMLNQASACAVKYSIISRAISRSPMITVSAPVSPSDRVVAGSE
jgi:hypothetical protein